MTIKEGYYVADCTSTLPPVSRKDSETFYLPVNAVQAADGTYEYEEYRFNLPVDYPFPVEILEYMANKLDEYRLAVERGLEG